MLANLPTSLTSCCRTGSSTTQLPPPHLSKGRLVGLACRIAMGTEDRMSVSAAVRTSCSSFSCVESVTRHAPTPPLNATAAAPAADPGEKCVKITTVV